jgi:capsular exopolysaccharide synthesis family protein
MSHSLSHSSSKLIDAPQDSAIPALAGHGAQPSKDISLADIWMVVRRRKLIISSCMTLMLLLAVAYCVLAPRRYEATARLSIDHDSANTLGINSSDPLNLFGDPMVMQETQVRIMQSDTVAWDVIRRLRLDKNPEFAKQKTGSQNQSPDEISPIGRVALLRAFHSRLQVSTVPKTWMIEMRFRSKDPKLAADIVNATTNAYLERNFRTRYNATMQASDWLSKQLDDLKQRVQSSQQQFVEFQKKNGIIGTDETHNIILSQLDELNKGLAASQAERIVREARYREALSADPKVIAEIAPSANLQVLRAQEADLKDQFAQASAKYGYEYPRVKQLQAQLSQVDASLRVEIKNVSQRLKSEYDAASRAEEMASGEVEKSKQQAYRMNEAGIEYLILKQDLEASRDLYQDLMKKLEEAGIVAGLKSTNVNVVDAAEIPGIPAEPVVVLDMLIALILGSAGGLGLAFLLENLDTSISSPEHVELFARMALLCVVPHLMLGGRNGTRPLKECERNKPLSLVRPQSPFAESFRALRTTLLLSSAGSPPKVLVITSAVPEEGKTTTAINVAVALARNQRRVLLVDADMHRRGLQERLGFENCAGLSGCLTGMKDDGQSAVVSLPELPSLHIVPAGARAPFPAELLGSDEMRQLLEGWRVDYDHIVIDTPPVLGLTDAIILATMADAVLLVARCGRTGRQTLCRAREALARVGAPTPRVILNDLNMSSPEYCRYYGYSSDQYGHYYGDKSLEN